MGDIEELKALLTENLAGLKEEVFNNKAQIAVISEENRQLKQIISLLTGKIQEKNENKLKTEIAHTFKRHRKSMIKHKIIEACRLRKLTLPELKEIIVDQFQYCSKASFYRYFEELQKAGSIAIADRVVLPQFVTV